MAGVTVSAAQVYQEALALGGTQEQAQVAAALVSGIESDGNTLELAGGIGPAQGLFQFEPGTWTGGGGGGKNGLPSTVAAATWQQQVQGFLNASQGNNFSPWGPDLGGSYGQDVSAPAAGSKVANIIDKEAASWGTTPVSDTATVGGTSTNTDSSSDPAVQQYLTALHQELTSTPGTPGLAISDAWATLMGTLNQYGLGSLGTWAWDELANGTSADQIQLDMKSQPAYQTSILGMTDTARQAAGLPAMSAADILSYKDTADQLARNAGLPQGFMTDQEISSLLGADVSSSELSQRITNGYEAAMNAPAETRALLSEYYGVNTGNLAAYYLNPNTAEPLLQQQLLAANIGEEGVASGFGDIGQANATQLAQTFAAEGKTQADANTGFKALAPLVPLENALPGQTGQPVVSMSDLLGYEFSGANVEEVQHAEDARKAPFGGGGGYLAGAKGVLGAGSASETGVQGT